MLLLSAADTLYAAADDCRDAAATRCYAAAADTCYNTSIIIRLRFTRDADYFAIRQLDFHR